MPRSVQILALVLLAAAVTSCAGPSRSASSGAFGTSEENPIRVAGLADGGPSSERAYLDRLRGPNGETVEYARIRSCCAFRTPRGIMDTGLLDVYEVTYPGLDAPVLLYLNMYDPPEGELAAPEGFTLAG